ncbi:ankyrin repeat domain-containing protein [Limnohabitans sp.]|uniref:ankyrin repeat domain-containing protein n=1 Tax=Limnohabitans sp. TaxID=1907725 RepID=UPI00286EF622|nr:ankyrin repeat domain-containing protein [Limnohabitans sp.]
MKKLIHLVLIGSGLLGMQTAAYAQKGMDQININGQFVMAARVGKVERVQALLDQGASVNSRDRNGDTPLNMAAAKGNADLVQALLKANADVNLANLSGVTPLMGAAFSANPQIFNALLAAGAKTEPLDRVKKNAATYAAAHGCTACLQDLVKAGTNVNAKLENDLTLLMWAAAYGQDETVRYLLSQGAEKEAKDNRGKSAVDLARDGNHLALAQLLTASLSR